MTATEKGQVETSLNEVRTLVPGAQILLGFQCRASFESGFPSLPGTAQHLQVTALVLLVASMACMTAPAPYHRFVSRGHATARAERYTKRMALLALVPFALALGMNFGVVLARQIGLPAACGIGAAVAAAALLCWLGPALARHRRGDPKGDEVVSTKDGITGLLTEARIVLPGVQALLGVRGHGRRAGNLGRDRRCARLRRWDGGALVRPAAARRPAKPRLSAAATSRSPNTQHPSATVSSSRHDEKNATVSRPRAAHPAAGRAPEPEDGPLGACLRPRQHAAVL